MVHFVTNESAATVKGWGQTTHDRADPIGLIGPNGIFSFAAESDSNFGCVSIRTFVVTIEIEKWIIPIHEFFCLLHTRKAEEAESSGLFCLDRKPAAAKAYMKLRVIIRLTGLSITDDTDILQTFSMIVLVQLERDLSDKFHILANLSPRHSSSGSTRVRGDGECMYILQVLVQRQFGQDGVIEHRSQSGVVPIPP